MQKYLQFIRYSIYLALLGLVLWQCKPKDEEAPLRGEFLVEATLIKSYTTAALRADLAETSADLEAFGRFLVYDIDVYKVVYNTKDFNGNAVQASGAMIVPRASVPVGLLSQQHGTITNPQQVPSSYNRQSEAFQTGSFLASSGYVLAAPDYLGYGVSADQDHPYEVSTITATTCIDMLRAVREFCNIRKVALNGKLFLTGYSQGGTATMAMHKYLEENLSSEFRVTASAPGAGAHNKTAFAKYVASQNTNLAFLSTYIWVLNVYNRYFNLNLSTTDVYNAPYAANIAAVPSPRLLIGLAPPAISLNPTILFTDNFRNQIANDTNPALNAALAANNVFDWRPQAPIQMVHGTADDYVPIFNSQDALNAMRARGANNVELIPIPGGNHFTTVPAYILSTYSFFKRF
ncbi:alpha/beta hydrolase family protein [Eisenibacter elegans]|uniref:alpha/beta hydrolase family protein n=1 Tax=Eisenibacter elegans TaxID=997 RepID=UPI0003F72DFA|nr:alpha/beta fold hydrolase [Eisenibacter elegans]